MCVEKKTKPVVPNKIGECENWFSSSSFQQVCTHSMSCRAQAPRGLKSVIARRLCSLPSGGVSISTTGLSGPFKKQYSNSASTESWPPAGPCHFPGSLTAGQFLFRTNSAMLRWFFLSSRLPGSLALLPQVYLKLLRCEYIMATKVRRVCPSQRHSTSLLCLGAQEYRAWGPAQYKTPSLLGGSGALHRH